MSIPLTPKKKYETEDPQIAHIELLKSVHALAQLRKHPAAPIPEKDIWYEEPCAVCPNTFDRRKVKMRGCCSKACMKIHDELNDAKANNTKLRSQKYKDTHKRMTRSLFTGDERTRIKKLLRAFQDLPTFSTFEAGRVLAAKSHNKVLEWLHFFEAAGILEKTNSTSRGGSYLWSFVNHAEIIRLKGLL